MQSDNDTNGAQHDSERERAAVNMLMIGTGEYTTGFVGGKAADSDKGAGVVALTMFDLRRRGKVDKVGLCGTNGIKMPAIRTHMQQQIGDVYLDMDLGCQTFPPDGEVNRSAYIKALEAFSPGDAVTIFTPDDTHFEIALAAIERGLHVLVTKPPVKTLEHHLQLLEASRRKGVLVMVEVHKRFDPIYVDAKDRIRNLGGFGYMNAYMSQPKHQLETFKAWAGKSSDISYYLNSHHIDFHEWSNQGIARPRRVVGTAATGVAKEKGIETEDTITLVVNWTNMSNSNDGDGDGDGDGSSSSSSSKSKSNSGGSVSEGVAVYTSSWVAPKSDVHSQQRFFYMGHKGEIRVDQAHRGYTVATDANGFASCNPLFMKYTPSDGYFSGQTGYGYKSFEAFVDAVIAINSESATVDSFDSKLPTIAATVGSTAILEAGRRSLDCNGQPFDIEYDENNIPSKLVPVTY